MANRSCGGRRAIAGVLALAAAILVFAGCSSGSQAYRQGEEASARQMWDSAVMAYSKAYAEDPQSTRYKVALARAKMRAATAHFERGKAYLANAQLELAVKELQQAVILDNTNEYAAVELQKANAELERRRDGPSDYDRARAEAQRRAADLGPPKLDPTSNIAISLKFPDSTVQDVYDSLSKASGINFLFDEKLDLKKKVSIELANVTFEKAMDVLMLTNKHFYKVIDSHTILLAEDSKQNHSTYDDHVIRTFYLSNAETQEIQNILRALLETRRLQENKNLNAIVMKDTPEKIKVAERIIAANDKAKGEVVVDIELLEINRTMLQTLGLDLSNKRISLVFGDGKQSVPLNNLSVLKQQSAWFLGPIPSVVFDFLRADSDSKSIARPQIRILEGDAGKITIGDRVPIPATSFNTSNTIGGNVVPITSFTYQNVGIIVEVKPRVHHNKEVTLDLKCEVSSLAGEVQGSGGVSQPIIGTRTVETQIRLEDGETNLLAGLIKEDERTALAGIPILSQIPILNRLFAQNADNASSTDIVLSITPHIVRLPNIRPEDLVPLWVGTEDKVSLRGVARNALGESPFGGTPPWEEIDRALNGDAAMGDEKAVAKTDELAAEDQQGTVKVSQPSSAKSGGPAAPPPAEAPRTQRSRSAPAAGAAAAGAAAGSGAATPPATSPGSTAASGAAIVPVPTSGEGSVAEPAPAAAPGAEGQEGGDADRPVSVAQVRLAPDRPQVAAGDPLGVAVLISGAEGVGNANFQLRYDPKVLRFAPSAEPGDFMAQGGAPVDVQAVEGAEGGLIIVSLARSGAGGASGSGALVRLNFVALAPGNAKFGFSSAAVRGVDSQVLPASFRVSSVEVTP